MSPLTLDQFIKSSSRLSGSIQNYKRVKCFRSEFEQIFGSQEAKNVSNVLYAFICDKKIPRVKSESNIIYIGKTKQSLCRRYLKYAKTFCSKYNWSFFSYILKHYGPVRINYLPIDTKEPLKKAETKLLEDYYELHREYPPKNSQRQ